MPCWSSRARFSSRRRAVRDLLLPRLMSGVIAVEWLYSIIA